ncbi:HET-domain-containing protein [Lojkania enalia]|uniref:HET-domain-containing protein n=1 Tax=Lojkania enalia TaxID=147567 RepID=A0A9P4K1D4_9PLEO|nr:HET-domain-containing protein [Didymosphaeria enalia]
MRLLHFDDSGRLVLTDFARTNIPPYAILSHRWWGDRHEVHFHEVLNNTYASKAGYRKIKFCAKQATQDHLQYFWVDTCCFDRYNNRERSNAVNSMFQWYQNATKCYVFLSDVSVATTTDAQQQSTWEAHFRASEWFTRAWTLQELIAPASVEFFSFEGQRLGDKKSVLQLIHDITSIPSEVLQGCPLEKFSVSDRIIWARDREATEPEDYAYCLLGILNVQIPLTYGEGKEKALSRLQEEVAHSDTTPSIIHFSRNKRFVGRQSKLAEVEAILFTGKQTTRIAITGEGGTGKSQLALEIAYRIKEKEKACSVFWIDASDIDSVYQAYASIAQKLKIPGWEDEEADAMRLVKLYLGEDYATHWLLIFDNVDSLAFEDAGPFALQSSSLIDYLPQSKFGSVIFTTTNNDVAQSLALQNIIELHKMAPDTAQEMFENHLVIPVPTNEKQEMKLLLERLSYLPLAIVQATAYINKNKIKVKDYLSLLTAQNMDAFQISSNLLEDKLPDYIIPSSVMITLLISLDQISSSHSLAAHFLALMACVDRKDILLDFLTPTGSQEREDAIKILSDYAVVTRRPAVSAVDLHRLIHLAVRRWIKKHKSLDEWTEKAIRHLVEVFPDHHHGNRSKWRRLLPHAKYVLSHSPLNLDNDDRMDLIWRCAMSLYEDGRYNEAEELFMQAMEIRKKKLGADHPSTLTSMANLASTYRNQGRWEAAEELEVQVMEIRKKKLGADHPSTLTSMNNLAFTWKGQGRNREAVRLMDECISSRMRVLGVHHHLTVSSAEALVRWRTEQLDIDEGGV